MLDLIEQSYLDHFLTTSTFKCYGISHCAKIVNVGVAAIAPWFRLRLPFCGPGFESQAHHLCFFQFVLKLWWEKNGNKQKRGRDWPI